MGFNLQEFLKNLTVVVSLAVSFIRTEDLDAYLSQKSYPEEEWPALTTK